MANISTMARTVYHLTAEDTANGYAAVPILWDSPFNDTNYNIAWSITDTGQNFVSLDYGVGDVHFKSREGFTAVIELPAPIPFIQGQADLAAGNVNTITPVILDAPITTLYMVTLYYAPSRSSALDAGKSWAPSITYTDPAGNLIVMSNNPPLAYLGSAQGGTAPNGIDYMQAFSIPLFVMGGTPITVDGAYTGGVFPMNISIRSVQMPNNALLPKVGSEITVEAMASHR